MRDEYPYYLAATISFAVGFAHWALAPTLAGIEPNDFDCWSLYCNPISMVSGGLAVGLFLRPSNDSTWFWAYLAACLGQHTARTVLPWLAGSDGLFWMLNITLGTLLLFPPGILIGQGVRLFLDFCWQATVCQG